MSVSVPLSDEQPLVQAYFVARPNQFLVEAEYNGSIVRAHMADRGRLEGLLVSGAKLVLAPRHEVGRKTAFQVVGVYQGKELVSLNTQLPNRLISAALSSGALPQFARFSRVQSEVTIGPHRFDFRLGDGLNTCVLEVKSASHIVDGLAMFPDAPTERGRNHFDALIRFTRGGQRCAVVFVVQRSAARALVPNDEVDPAFGRSFRAAISAGVEIYAYLCPLSLKGITLGDALPIFGSLDAIPIEF